MENSNEEVLIYDIKSPIQVENINSDYRNSNYKKIKIYFDEIQRYVILKQDYRIGKGGIFWDGSYILTKVLYAELLKNRKEKLNILELGAGTALPSLFCSYLNHKVTITDIKKNMNFINDIVNSNELNEEYKPIVSQLNWENEEDINNIKTINPSFNIIIGSELIYMDEYFDDLINVLKKFSNSSTQIILSYKIRLPELTASFLSKFAEQFEYSHVEDRTISQYYPLPNKLKILIAKAK